MKSDTRMPAPTSFAITGASVLCCPDIEPTFGGELRPPLGHETDGVRLRLERDRDHLVGRCHLEVERLCNLRLQAGHILVADVAAVLAQMRGDAVGSGRDRYLRGPQGIRITAATRIAHGGDMVDVDAESKRRNCCHGINSSWSDARLTHSRVRPAP